MDSTYAIAIALGRWTPRARNRELARRVHAAYTSLRTSRPRGSLAITHVRAHTRITGNEMADRLAKRAAAHGPCDGDTAVEHARDLLREGQDPTSSSPSS